MTSVMNAGDLTEMLVSYRHSYVEELTDYELRELRNAVWGMTSVIRDEQDERKRRRLGKAPPTYMRDGKIIPSERWRARVVREIKADEVIDLLDAYFRQDEIDEDRGTVAYLGRRFMEGQNYCFKWGKDGQTSGRPYERYGRMIL